MAARDLSGLLQLCAALLIALPRTPFYGIALGALIMVAAVATVVLYREYAHAIPAIVALILLALAVRGTARPASVTAPME